MEAQKTTTVKMLLDQLNQAVQVLVGVKQTASDFHDKVRDIVNPILRPLQLEYRTWDIYVDGEWKGNYMFDKLFILELERIDDKRGKYKTSWRNISLSFAPVIDALPSVGVYSIEEYLTLARLRDLQGREQTHLSNIEEFNEKIRNSNKEIELLRQQIAPLKKELGIES